MSDGPLTMPDIFLFVKENIPEVELVEAFHNYIYDYKFKEYDLYFSFFYSGRFYGFFYPERKHVPYTTEDILEEPKIPINIKRIIIFNINIFQKNGK